MSSTLSYSYGYVRVLGSVKGDIQQARSVKHADDLRDDFELLNRDAQPYVERFYHLPSNLLPGHGVNMCEWLQQCLVDDMWSLHTARALRNSQQLTDSFASDQVSDWAKIPWISRALDMVEYLLGVLAR